MDEIEERYAFLPLPRHCIWSKVRQKVRRPQTRLNTWKYFLFVLHQSTRRLPDDPDASKVISRSILRVHAPRMNLKVISVHAFA